MLQECRQLPGVRELYVDKQWARICLYRASALEGLGKKAEAAKAYQAALKTQYAKTGDGKVEASSYLMTAHRWNEAADNLQVLAAQLATYDFRMTQETIHTYLLPKYFANVKANRLDSAIAVGTWICQALDSAIVWQKHDDAAELATIYETQQKENELMEQRSNLSDMRLLTVYITLVLVILGFGLFIFFRHRAAVRLEKAYYDLERANMRAEESSRMKSDFIQQISHEIRTPLNILSGYTQLLAMPDMTYDKATLDNIKEQITENTDRITNLVNKMLELSEAKNRSDIECNDDVTPLQIAVEAIGISGVDNASHLTFSMIASPECEEVHVQTNLQAAARALSQVLDNARKFTIPSESRQHEKPTDHQQKVVLRISVSSSRLFFSVEDTGIGIPHKEAERIFDEFVQLDEFYEGTGIGLTVARSLARRIGGDIMLDTAYIGGSRFVLTLPVNK
jgi:signal transduction histidine kinase